MTTAALAASPPGAVDDHVQLVGRVRELAAIARAAAGAVSSTEEAGLGSRIDAELTGIAVRVAEHVAGQPYDPATSARSAELLSEIASVQDELRAHVRGRPFRALERVRDALENLRDAASSVELVDSASAQLCTAGGFDRAMISHVRGSTWVPHRLHVANEPTHPANVALREFARDARIPLTSAMYETELVRRRAPALIHDARDESRTFRPVVELSGSRSYVVVPLTVAGSVVGFFHADSFSTGRGLTGEDRDVAHAFADGFGLLFEHAVLSERLAVGRAHVRAAFAATRGVGRELVDAPVSLSRTEACEDANTVASADGPARDGTLAGRLTAREREVLAILASGASNDRIAAELVIAQSTVKTHLKHIMRKLGAANRAEAVSLFLRISRTRQGQA